MLFLQERDFLNEELDLSLMYSKLVSDLYIKEAGLPLLLIRAPFFNTCSGILLSYGIPAKVKGVETSKLIHSFLDSSSINSSNSRLGILLPIYCALKQVLSSFDLLIHNQLVNQISLRIFDGSPKSYPISAIIDANSNELITYHVQDALIKEGSEISTYIDSLDIELDEKEIVNVPLGIIGLPRGIQYDSEKDIRLIIQWDESKHFERKPYLTCDPIKKCINKGKEFDVMKTIDSFLNTEGGRSVNYRCR